MLDEEYDPYECHARHFLHRLQRLLAELSQGTSTVQELTPRLDKRWPQVLAAFWWATRQGSESRVGNDIREGFLACANGDIAGMQFRRSSLELQEWSASLRKSAQEQPEPNDAAFLYRFAGIANIQAAILKITEDTGEELRAVLNVVKARMTGSHPSSGPENE